MLIKQLVKPIGLKYVGKEVIGHQAYSLTFKPTKPFKWQAGQHILLEVLLDSEQRGVESFPIVSAPCEKELKIATKINPDNLNDFKKVLLNLKPGKTINTRGVFGHTIVKKPAVEYAFLTTGIGIATFRAILKQLIADGLTETKITLFFVGDKDSHYFKEELAEFKTTLKNLSIKYIYKPERITGELIANTMGSQLQKTIYFLAGSPTLVRNYRRILLGLGVPRKLVKSNHYLLVKHHQNNNPNRLLSIKR
jgi:ferredoxin-NADP reductase